MIGSGHSGDRRLPHSRVLLHQPYGQVTDLEIAAKEILRMRVIGDGDIDREDGIRAGASGQSHSMIRSKKLRNIPSAAGSCSSPAAPL